MFFSVIVPVYNVEKYLSECVDSILSQTFTNFELILVNDGSKDGSGAICDAYAQKDSRVKVIHKENGGLSDARNKGTAIAQGQYIIYIDSDDYLSKTTFFEDVYQKAQYGADIICYKFKKYFENTGTFGRCEFTFPNLDKYATYASRIEYLVMSDAFYCSAWTKAIRTSLLKDNAIEFEKGLLGEDQEWYYHVLLKAESIDGIDEDYIVYRQRANSITSSWKMKNLTDCIYIIEKWKNGIEQSGASIELKNALYNSLAKLYCNLLIGYCNFNDKEKKKQYTRLKKMKTLFKYAKNPRVRIIKKLYSIVGFDIMLFGLKLICLMKTRKNKRK